MQALNIELNRFTVVCISIQFPKNAFLAAAETADAARRRPVMPSEQQINYEPRKQLAA